MSTIIDPELTVRLGAPAPDEAARIEEYATAAFLWRGLRQAEALEVARGLHWRAVGRDPDAPAAEVVDALSLRPLAPAERDRLAALLDARCDLRPALAGRPGLDDFRRLGRRLAVALNLLDSTGTIV